jgi:AP-2 complex subunit mu-1
LETKEIRSPIKTINGITFLHIRTGPLYVVAIAKQNVNAAMVFEMLIKLVETFQSYFKVVTEESIRANFVLIYELLDEVLDFGYPQHCSREVLQAIITQGKARYNMEKNPVGVKVTK